MGSRPISQDPIVQTFKDGDFFPFVQLDETGTKPINVRMMISQLFSSLKAASAVKVKFVSDPLTITKASVQSAAHNLKATPTFFHLYIQCITAEYGYAVGELVRLDAYDATVAGTVKGVIGSLTFTPTVEYYGGNVSVDDKKVYAVFAKDGVKLLRKDQGNIGVPTVITEANWQAILLAYS